MENFKRYLPWAIRITISILFLLSAVAKLYPSMNFALGTFEAKQLIPMGFSEDFAPYFSRFLIAAEFALGFAILQPHYLKRFVIPVSAFLLAVFSIQLSYEIVATGNSGNCGCFGELIPMTPLQALIKNIIAIAMLGYLFKVTEKDDRQLHRFAYPLLIFTTVTTFMFAKAPIQFATEQYRYVVDGGKEVVHSDFIEDTTEVNDTIHVENGNGESGDSNNSNSEENPELPKPKGPAMTKSKFSDFPAFIPPGIKIDEGRKILCLFAPGCEHCQAAAKTLTEMRATDPDFPPVHIVFIDEEVERIPKFFEDAGRTYSYKVAPVVDFWKILDFSRDTPGVCFLWNGNIRYFADGINEKEFTKASLRKALDKKN